VRTSVSEYTVTAVTSERRRVDGSIWDIRVQRLLDPEGEGEERWRVLWTGSALTQDHKWGHEAEAGRFTLDEALRLAKAAAPHLVVSGRRPDGSIAIGEVDD
jgi:hypothetical protein